MINTREKILVVAEQLFAEQGFSSTSLRQITAKAEVNLAAIHYHFGSKEILLDELIRRKVDPVNAERLSRLAHLEARAVSKPPTVDEILDAFLAPAAAAAETHPEFARVMGRIHAEGLMPAIVQKHFLPTAQTFLTSLRGLLPKLSDDEFAWRVHFMMGAMAHTMCGTPTLPGKAENFHGRMRKLVTFVSAGLRAPATPIGEKS
jgi:AcrR family transcriptional regulator